MEILKEVLNFLWEILKNAFIIRTVKNMRENLMMKQMIKIEGEE